MTKVLCATLFFVSVISPAFSEAARRIDFTTALYDADGKVITECIDDPAPKEFQDCKSRRPVTLGTVTMRALTAPEQNLLADESLRRGQLALVVYKSTGAALTTDEITLIKKQIAKFYAPMIVVRAFPILDPASVQGMPK